MTIERKGSKKTLTCDDCGQELKNTTGAVAWYQSDEWDVMISDAKEMGWTIRNIGTDHVGKPMWEHTCDECQ